MFRIFIQNHPTMGPLYRRFDGSPGWVKRAAIIAAVLVVLVPLVLLTLAAVAVGFIVFVALAALVTVVWALRRFFVGLRPQADDGRRNVRVIDRA